MLKICAPSSINFGVLLHNVQSVNPDMHTVILAAYYDLCGHYGIDPAVAIAQAVLETDWFRSTAALADHNYCGLGITKTGVQGFHTDSVILGVMAHISHLMAYCGNSFNTLAALVDSRYSSVFIGRKQIAIYVDDLGGPGKWNEDPQYGNKIWRVYKELGGV